MENKILTLSKACKYLGMHPKTLQRLDKIGELKAQRTSTNRRFYTVEQLNKFKKDQKNRAADVLARKIINVVRSHYARMES